MRPPRFVQTTDRDGVSVAELMARLDDLASLPAALRARVAVQLRDPQLPIRALLALGASLRARTRALGASLLVNDRLDLALALGADGVHLGRRSVSVAEARSLLGREAWISCSAHDVREVRAAAAAGASAVLLSPVLASPGKGSPLGLETLAEARRLLDRARTPPLLVALGGIDAASARAARDARADAVAAHRAPRARADILDYQAAHGR
ncbi:MAG: thiamine phosphate synthase [Polyangiaceae bacterium]